MLEFVNPELVGGEAPKVKDCPRDIEVVGRNGTAITWIEPIFTDNVKVTRISNNEVRDKFVNALVNVKTLNDVRVRFRGEAAILAVS